MIRHIPTITLIFVGIINLLPVVGVIGGNMLNNLYDVTLDDPNLELLMRHRAILFGIIGGYILLAAFDTKLRLTAILIGLVSMLSFVVLFLIAENPNEALRRIFVIDVFASIILLFGYFISLYVPLEME